MAITTLTDPINGEVYDSQELRLIQTASLYLPDGLTFNGVRSGVLYSGVMSGGVPDDLKVIQNSTANNQIKVRPGKAVVKVATTSGHGAYIFYNHVETLLSTTAQHATLPRIDTVFIKIAGTDPASSESNGVFTIVAGTPASSPVAPATPTDGQYLALADFLVSPASIETSPGQITTADITDRRLYTTAIGGTLYCEKTAHRPTAAPVDQMLFDNQTKSRERWNGTAWKTVWMETPPRVRLARRNNATLPHAVAHPGTEITWDSVVENNASMFAGSSGTEVTIQKDGKYSINVRGVWGGSSSLGVREFHVLVNGVIPIGGSDYEQMAVNIAVSNKITLTKLQLVTGDKIKVYCRQTSANSASQLLLGNSAVTSNGWNGLDIVWEGP